MSELTLLLTSAIVFVEDREVPGLPGVQSVLHQLGTMCLQCTCGGTVLVQASGFVQLP